MNTAKSLPFWWRSIGQRLTILLAGVAAVLAVLSWWTVTTFAREAAEQTQDNVLVASATTIAEALRSEQGTILLELPYSAFAMLDAIGQDRVFYRVSAEGVTLTGYDDLAEPAGPVRRSGAVTVRTINYRGDPVRAVTVQRTVLAGQQPVPVLVTVAQTRTGVDAIGSELSQTAAGLSVALFVLAVGLGAVAASNALKPLNSFAQAVSRRGPADLRPLRRQVPAELSPLLIALNRLMERLGHSIRRSEEFIAEAAHRVRTPLATVRVQAELALHTVEKDEEKQMLRRIIRAVDESSRSASQLLDHATVSFRADALAQDHVDLAELAARVSDGLAPTADMKDIAINLNCKGPADVRGDAILLESALRNVLDNSVKYSPAETDINVTLDRMDDKFWRLTIRDHGRGFSAPSLPDLTARFQRGTNVDQIVGSGLGLTIAKEVLDAHGGRITLTNPDDGAGACVSLILPAA
ncbi:two-component system, OmpR family, sensor histidine kinase TctE [Yoonia rosea]|uniref:histidine kinase n=1 Tax=Yoonia rosea TaxID=287098 RepID=A0A1R3WJ62_9RHOB|nr:sensor histidine kinase [Yoonia rosea]SIT77945.1 two-component system, OmpR family, sensor histidine kinase TctE [Yoonia rosea]